MQHSELVGKHYEQKDCNCNFIIIITFERNYCYLFCKRIINSFRYDIYFIRRNA